MAATPGASTSRCGAGYSGLGPSAVGTVAQSDWPASQVCSALNQSVPGLPGSFPTTVKLAGDVPGNAALASLAVHVTSRGLVLSVQPSRGSARTNLKPAGSCTASAVVAVAPLHAWP